MEVTGGVLDKPQALGSPVHVCEVAARAPSRQPVSPPPMWSPRWLCPRLWAPRVLPSHACRRPGGEGGQRVSWSLGTGGGSRLGGGWAGSSSPLSRPGPRGSVGSTAQESQQPQAGAPSADSPGKPGLLPVPAQPLAPVDTGTSRSVTGLALGSVAASAWLHQCPRVGGLGAQPSRLPA